MSLPPLMLRAFVATLLRVFALRAAMAALLSCCRRRAKMMLACRCYAFVLHIILGFATRLHCYYDTSFTLLTARLLSLLLLIIVYAADVYGMLIFVICCCHAADAASHTPALLLCLPLCFLPLFLRCAAYYAAARAAEIAIEAAAT